MSKKPKPGKGTPLDVDAARSLGREARREGKPPEACPYGDYPGRQFKSAWFEGYEDAAPRPLPVVHIQSVTVVSQGTFWPADRPLPEVYVKQKSYPCPSCKLHRLHSGAQAVITTHVYGGIARLRCQSCGATHKLPVKEEQ